MAKRPWIKFHTRDWRLDARLQTCSIAARGLWIGVIGLMHDESEHKGFLLVGRAAPTSKSLAGLLNVPEDETVSLLKELGDAGVYSITGDPELPEDLVDLALAPGVPDGVMFSRRIVRDEAFSDLQSAFGKMGGNPRLKAPLIPRVRDQSQKSEERKKEREEAPSVPRPRGSRLPDDWQPSAENKSFAASLNLDPVRVATKFRNYWHGLAGAKAVKMNWSKTWDNWCISDAERSGSMPKSPSPAPYVKPKFN